MRKFVAIVTALGFLGATSLTPLSAAPAQKTTDGVTAQSDELSAAKHVKKKKKAKKKSKKKKSKKKMQSSLIGMPGEFSSQAEGAAKPKKAKKAKKKGKKAKKKTSSVIMYRVAA